MYIYLIVYKQKTDVKLLLCANKSLIVKRIICIR